MQLYSQSYLVSVLLRYRVEYKIGKFLLFGSVCSSCVHVVVRAEASVDVCTQVASGGEGVPVKRGAFICGPED